MDQIDKTKVPRHVAIIMDGNGRWAQSQGLPRLEGHRQGAVTVENITEAARTVGVSYLTLYAFSQENWNRPDDETAGLMQLLTEFLISKKEKMIKNGIRLHTIGRTERLPEPVKELLWQTIEATSAGDKMTLTLALSYGSRDEILRAVQKISQQVKEGQVSGDQISEELFESALDTEKMPDPDLVIRTSGENRVSNFLLWQSAYAEYIFIEPNWPEFTEDMFLNCIAEYQKRERRFGLISEQVND
ncbi:MAG: isoprenyl transferase [Deltaproteobacteria bacterium]|nr:isoprenyl transferase [Deltaproteobacteria bacterium]